MSVKEFRAESVRCLEQVRLEPARNNLIFGENASGKTSLLEALFVLGRGRSFRRGARNTIIRDQSDSMTVSATLQQRGIEKRIGIGLSRTDSPQIRVDGRDESSAASLAEWMPVQVIDPDVHNLIAEGPSVRRRFLDWGLFHVEPLFLDTWRRYQRAMKQRNAALRLPGGDLQSWDEQLVAEGEKLDLMRASYSGTLAAVLQKVAATLLDGLPAMTYRRGWPEDKTLATALAEAGERDRRHGFSHVGPHRADLAISVEERSAKGRVSRGQQKLLAAALVIAQAVHLKNAVSVDTILLLDDLPAELDATSLDRLLAVIRPLEAQVFMTSLERRDFNLNGPTQVFHVEQGKVRSVL